MANKKPALGPLGSKFFSLMQVRHQTIVQIGELEALLNLTSSQAHTLLKRLANNGYLFRLQKGAYLVPEKLPAGGPWRPNDYIIIDQYMKLLDAKYYIGGFNALYHHGITQQIPNQFTVYNDKLSGKRNFGKLAVRFIKTQNENIIGFSRIKMTQRDAVNMATLARTLLDLIRDWNRYHSVENAYQWIKGKQKDEKFLKELIKLTTQSSNKNTIRRIGYMLEQLSVPEKKLLALKQKLGEFKRYILLLPDCKKIGKKNKKWQVIDNAK